MCTVTAADHPGFRQLLRLKHDFMPEVEIIGEVEDGSQLLEILKQVQADMGIMDILLPIASAKSFVLYSPRPAGGERGRVRGQSAKTYGNYYNLAGLEPAVIVQDQSSSAKGLF